MHCTILATLGLAVLLPVTGCILHLDGTETQDWTSSTSPQAVRNLNRSRLDKLEVGMTIGEVREIMGTEAVWTGSDIGWINNPYRSESFPSKDGETVRIHFYYTHLTKRDNVINDDELTPLAFVGGTLDGWGWSYFERNIKEF